MDAGHYAAGTTRGMVMSAVAHAVVLIVAAFSAPRVVVGVVETAELAPFGGRPSLIFASDAWAEPEGAEGGPADVAAVGTEGERSRCGGRAPKAMGTRVARAGNRFGISGPRDNPDPHMAQASGRSAADHARVGIRSRAMPNAPAVPWGRDDALGNDDRDARGGMWGDAAGDAAGREGLAPAGTCDECGGSEGTSRAETNGIGGIVRAAMGFAPLLGRGGGLGRGFSGTVGRR